MKCPNCNRKLECVNVKRNGMWSNHWECKEHGTIDHNSFEFQNVAIEPKVIEIEVKVDVAVDFIPLDITVKDVEFDKAKDDMLDAIAYQYGIKRK